MNFDKVFKSLVSEARVRDLNPEEILKKGIEYKNLTVDKGAADHPLPDMDLLPSGAIKYRTGGLGSTELRSAAISKKHLEQSGGHLNQRVDTFRIEVAKLFPLIDKAKDEDSLLNVSKTLTALLSRLAVNLKNENTEIPLTKNDYVKIDKVIKDVRNKITSKVSVFARIAQQKKLPFDIRKWKQIDSNLDTLVRKDFDDFEKLIKQGSYTRMQSAPGQHFFALDLESSFNPKTGETHWIIYTKKSRDKEGNYIKGNLPFIKQTKVPNVWPEPLPDVRKGLRKPPTLWQNGAPKYGVPVSKELLARRGFKLQDGQIVSGIKIDEFSSNIGDQIIFDVIKAKYHDGKTGIQTFGTFKIDLDKLTVEPYGLKKESSKEGEVPEALHQKKVKPPIGASSAASAGASSQEDEGSDEEEEF